MKNKIIILLLIIVIVIFGIVSYIFIKNKNKEDDSLEFIGELSGQINQDIERETKEEDVLEGIVVDSEQIDLSSYTENVTLKKGGKYILTGDLNGTLRIDTDEEITLDLNNVNIKGQISSAIVNLQKNNLIINLLENTINNLEDNGNSVYDACIYSNGNIIIKGTGELNITSKQIYSEGIATNDSDITINSGTLNINSTDDGINTGGDNGGTITINDGNILITSTGDALDSNKDIIINNGTLYAVGGATGSDGALDSDKGIIINGGIVIGTGYNYIETPLIESTQNTILVNLDKTINRDIVVSLTNEFSNELITFNSLNKFNKLTISHPYISLGDYMLYTNNSYNGNIIQGIYYDGEVTLKDVINFDGNSIISIYDSITEVNAKN